MTGPNGHAQDTGASTSVGLPTALPIAAPTQFPPEKVKELVAELEVPFDPAQIEWRVMNTTKNGQPMRGQVVPYADQRAYTDRLNALFTPATGQFLRAAKIVSISDTIVMLVRQ